MNSGKRHRRVLMTSILGLALCAWSLPAMGQYGAPSSGQPQQGQQAQPPQGQAQPGTTGGQAAGQPSGSAATQDPNQRAANMINTMNQNQIDLGKMMQDQGQSANVKSYSKSLADEHQQAQDKLQSLATKSNMTLQTNQRMKDSQAKLKDKLSSAQGTQRDRDFLQAEVRSHSNAIQHLTKMESQVTDPQLKTYITELIPTLQKHESEAKTLLQQMGGPAAGAPAGQAQPQATPQQAPPAQPTPPPAQPPPMR